MKLRLLDAEGMAMSGLVEDAKIVEVGKNKAKIVVVTNDGEVLETEEVDKEVAAKSYFIILQYVRQWGKRINVTR
ncbi:hypothetical protein [Ignicoccus hospitalis]|nr:hypothetical protein [Ignicoccus hospitalis]HIH91023.1 hypothetical protein [Desulfurococcaceae archaeon]